MDVNHGLPCCQSFRASYHDPQAKLQIIHCTNTMILQKIYGFSTASRCKSYKRNVNEIVVKLTRAGEYHAHGIPQKRAIIFAAWLIAVYAFERPPLIIQKLLQALNMMKGRSGVFSRIPVRAYSCKWHYRRLHKQTNFVCREISPNFLNMLLLGIY